MFLTRERDPLLRRFERDQALATLAMAAIGAFWRLDFALGVLGGGLLMAMSYAGIKGGVEGLIPSADGAAPLRPAATRRRAALAAKFAGRYALLALSAYVMLTRLRAHPAGLLIGATSPAVAVTVEALRVARTWSRSRHSR